ncbi:Fibroblast growth factor receptor [Desmophyllum pertusum]|uniref:Fibroblast growth factor receptor n=1 Tax=Desmophyllum pertusum TaxID=174260 RepID=A0A9X0D5W6_9CNID|nr:Fibroblast growth factor receptor [Desmophyllum pertusum]
MVQDRYIFKRAPGNNRFKSERTFSNTYHNGPLGKNSTLMLRDVTRSDAGAYVCWKSNGYNVTANVTVFIDVAEPSTANISTLSPPQYVNEGSDARFICTVSGSPRPTVAWLKGKETIAVCEGKQHGNCTITAPTRDRWSSSKYKSSWLDERDCMKPHSSGPTSGRWSSSLKVLKSQYPGDAVDYTCVVNNGLGQPEEQVTTLEIIVKPVLVKESNTGMEKPLSLKTKPKSWSAKTNVAIPRLSSVGDTSHCNVKIIQTLQLARQLNQKKWRASRFGNWEDRKTFSPTTSVLIVPANIDKRRESRPCNSSPRLSSMDIPPPEASGTDLSLRSIDNNITEDPITEDHQLVTGMLAPAEDQHVSSAPVTQNQTMLRT